MGGKGDEVFEPGHVQRLEEEAFGLDHVHATSARTLGIGLLAVFANDDRAVQDRR
jgi:hypothetical protein